MSINSFLKLFSFSSTIFNLLFLCAVAVELHWKLVCSISTEPHRNGILNLTSYQVSVGEYGLDYKSGTN